MKQKLNRIWHMKNKMPEKPTPEQRVGRHQQRVGWHLEHQKYCGCRPIPEKLMQEIRKNKK